MGEPPSKKPKTRDVLSKILIPRRGDVPDDVDPFKNDTFDWYELCRPAMTAAGTKTKTVPQLFTLPIHQWVQAPMRNEFRIVSTGMRVEVPCTDYLNQWLSRDGHKVFWVGHIMEVRGYRARLRYVGCEDEQYDFWVSLCAQNVHHIGYAAAHSYVLTPPAHIREKQQDWKSYLINQLVGARTLYPDWTERVTTAFKKTYKFTIGMRIECIDRAYPNRIAPFRVKAIVGTRMWLTPSYDDWPADAKHLLSDDTEKSESDDETKISHESDYWFSFHSHLIFPVGWAQRIGYPLHANQAYKDHCEHLIKHGGGPSQTPMDGALVDSRPDCFAHSPLNRIDIFDNRKEGDPPNSLKWIQGYKFECINPIDMNCFNVASVKNVLPDGWLMVSFDGEGREDDVFPVHMRSPYIFPADFCKNNNLELKPLKRPDGEKPPKHDWQAYLQQEKAISAPVELFENPQGTQHDRMPFKVGMKVECVDRCEPKLICVGTVKKVVQKRLLIVHFDGWDADYDQFVDYRSFDIYPVGYCEAVGYVLTQPKEATMTKKK